MVKSAWVAAVLLLAAGCSTTSTREPTPALGSVPGVADPASVTNEDATRESSWVYGAFPVCVTGDAPVTLDSVQTQAVGGAKVVRVGIRPYSTERGGIASGAGPLDLSYVPVAGTVVAVRCGQGYSELALELRGAGSTTSAAIDGFTLLYREAGELRSAPYRVRITLCAGGDTGSGQPALADCAQSGLPPVSPKA